MLPMLATQPITGPFGPKKKNRENFLPQRNLSQVIFTILLYPFGVDLEERNPKITEHRGIFKNPFLDTSRYLQEYWFETAWN